MTILRRSAKDKSVRVQNWFRDLLIKRFACHPDDVKTAIMGESGVDIHLSPAMQERFPYAVEVKNRERINVWEAWDQAQGNAKCGQEPLVIFKRNRSETLAIVRAEHLVDLAICKEWCRE